MLDRYLFRLWNAASYSFQWKFAPFFMAWKKGLHLSVDWLRNRFKAARLPFNI